MAVVLGSEEGPFGHSTAASSSTSSSSRSSPALANAGGGGGLKRSISQPKLSHTLQPFRRSSSATCLSDLGHASSTSNVGGFVSSSTKSSFQLSFDASESDSDPDSECDNFIFPSYGQAFAPHIVETKASPSPSLLSSTSSTTSLASTSSQLARSLHGDKYPPAPPEYQTSKEKSTADMQLGYESDKQQDEYRGEHVASSGPLLTELPVHPVINATAEDDMAAVALPSRHVDYFSHNWREEDVWSSWKFIVARRNEYTNSARLENASWRTWMQQKNHLQTVPAIKLNWLKDYDVTWLYGPLQPGSNMKEEEPEAPPTTGTDVSSGTSNAPSTPSTNSTQTPTPRHQTLPSDSSAKKNRSSATTKKPILKKRTMSELMLQRSISTSSLLKQATAEVQAQQSGLSIPRQRIPPGSAPATDILAPFASSSDANTAYTSSAVSSGMTSPYAEKKRIHFNESVEQCIAIDHVNEGLASYRNDGYDEYSESDDDAVMMKRTVQRKRRPIVSSFAKALEACKTIEKLPNTTLKTDTEQQAAIRHGGNSASLETQDTLTYINSTMDSLHPKGIRHAFSSSHNFLQDLDEDEDEDDDDPNPSLSWDYAHTTTNETATTCVSPRPTSTSRRTTLPSAATTASSPVAPKSTLTPSASVTSLLSTLSAETVTVSSPSAQRAGVRRSESGLLVPQEGPTSQPTVQLTPDDITIHPHPLDRTTAAAAASSPPFVAGDEEEEALALEEVARMRREDTGDNSTILGRVIDTVNTAKDIAHVIWNVGWSK